MHPLASSCSLSLWIITSPTLPAFNRATLAHCIVAPLPHFVSPLLLSTFDACFSLLAPLRRTRRKFKPDFVSYSSISRATTKQTCRYCFTSVISLITQHHPTRSASVVSAVYRLWSTTLRRSRVRAHLPETNRGHRTVQFLIARIYVVPLPVAFLDLFVSPFAAPVSTLLYTKSNIVSASSCLRLGFPSLMPATWLLSPLYRPSPSTTTPTPSYQHPHQSASCSFGPTRTLVDTLLDFVPSSFGFSSMVFDSGLGLTVPVPPVSSPPLQHWPTLAIALSPYPLCSRLGV